MNKEEQIKFITDNYPVFTNQNAVRRVRHSFFSNIETEIQAYLLGFYAADGNINEKRKTFRIELQKGDVEIIQLYKDFIGIDSRMYTTKERTFIGPKDAQICAHGNIGIDINSTQICNDLVKLGIGYSKSYKELHIPNMPKDLIRHFIRGYFDGDGSFTYGVYKEKSKPNPYLKVRWDIESKTISLLQEFQMFLLENSINTNIIHIKRDDMWRLNTASKKECKKIYTLLYNDSNFYLSRKYNKFNHYVNTEETQFIAEFRNAQEMSVNKSNNSPKSVEPLPDNAEGEDVC